MRCKQKILALLLAVALLLAMSSTALADGKVCAIGEEEYASLQDAVNEVKANPTLDGSTITLTAIATENVTIPDGVEITLDLAGHTLDGGTASGEPALMNNGTVTIMDSSDAGTGTIKRSDNGPTGTYYTIQNEGTMTITGGKIENNSGSANTWSGSSLICNGLTNNATLTISGGTIKQDNFIAVKNDEKGTLNITGGTISSNTQAVQNWCDATISGGNLTGAVTTWAYSDFDGETTISGGTINGDVCAYWFNGGSYEVKDGIIPKVTIQEGAMITGKLQKGTTTSVNGPTTEVAADNPGGTIIVYGGTFTNPDTSTITPYLASGFELVGSDGKYVVKKASSHDDDDDGSIGYPPTILSPTGNQVVAVMANGTVTLSVDATRVGFGGYQWFVNRGDGLGFVPVAGATGPSLTLYPTFADNGSQYYCRVMNGYGYVNSGYFTLSVVGGMVPKTGDQVSVTLWVCLMALGVAGAATVLARRRSR